MPRPPRRTRGHVYWHSAALFISDNVATQIDGLAHITAGLDFHWYNGFKEAEWGGDWGPRKCDASTIPPIVARGVLIDVAAFKKVDALPGHTLISTKDLQDTLAWEGVTLAPGDVVLVRTGTARYWGDDGADHATIAAHDSAGPDLTATKWLVEDQGAIMVGSDTSGYEVNPAARRAGHRHPRPSLPARRAGRPPGRVPQPRGAQQGQGLHVLLRRHGQQDQGDRRRLRAAADRIAVTVRPARSRSTITGQDRRILLRDPILDYDDSDIDRRTRRGPLSGRLEEASHVDGRGEFLPRADLRRHHADDRQHAADPAAAGDARLPGRRGRQAGEFQPALVGEGPHRRGDDRRGRGRGPDHQGHGDHRADQRQYGDRAGVHLRRPRLSAGRDHAREHEPGASAAA